ncbi:MAG: hypothetical protein KQI62_12680 [Deltaproteobacteria bacterium]|nr:hypothetical protein [Deltaproteobacteria bacterium]
MRWFFPLLVCLTLIAGAAFAQATEAPIVLLKAKPEQVTTPPGGEFQLDLVLNIAPKFHINGPSAGDAGLIPLAMKLVAPNGLSFSPPAFPKAKQVRVQFADKPVEMYSGQVIIGLKGKAAQGLKPGVYQVSALISYQACDDMVCHMPFNQELPFEVKVVAKP